MSDDMTESRPGDPETVALVASNDRRVQALLRAGIQLDMNGARSGFMITALVAFLKEVGLVDVEEFVQRSCAEQWAAALDQIEAEAARQRLVGGMSPAQSELLRKLTAR
jgi:hypothetical protein